METYDTILSKRDTRAYEARAILHDVLLRIVQAGRMAGSAKNAQPVRLVVVRDQPQKEALAACGDYTPHLPVAAAAIVIVLVPEEGKPPGEFAMFRGPFDAGRCAQNMMLAAWDQGITSCPVTMHRGADAAKVLGLPPGHVVANVIALGYPADGARHAEPRPRLPVEEYVHWERW
jgi:nitroreductase